MIAIRLLLALLSILAGGGGAVAQSTCYNNTCPQPGYASITLTPWTTGTRPSVSPLPYVGTAGYNSTFGLWEWYSGAGWVQSEIQENKGQASGYAPLNGSAFVPAANLAPIPCGPYVSWPTGVAITAGQYDVSPYFPSTSGLVTGAFWYSSGTGSFTAQVTINGTSVTGLAALNVNSSTGTLTPATGANTLAVGNKVSVTVSALTSSPVGPAAVQVVCTRSYN